MSKVFFFGVALIMLNLIDAACTIYQVRILGLAETNPLLSSLAEERPVLFVLAKMSLILVGMGIIVWAEARGKRYALPVFRWTSLLYLFIVGWHVALLAGA